MANIFWNREERRIRALWRIFLQAAIFYLVAGLFNYLVILLATVIGRISFADPDWFGRAIMYIQLRPPWRAFSILLEIAGAVAGLWLAGLLLDRRKFADFGFHLNRRWWTDLAFGSFLGAFLMALIFLAELAAGWVEVTGTMWVRPLGVDVGFWAVTLVAFLHYISVAVREEIFSRAYHLRNIAEGLHLPRVTARAALLAGYIISSSMFGLFHLGNPNASAVSTINIIFAGLFLGLGFVLTGELAIPIGLHLTWNFFQGRVFGFPVSGGATNSSFIAIRQLGPEAWTGGSFGPEAGIVGLIAIALGCALTWLWVKWRYGEAKLRDDLAVYKKSEPPSREERGETPGGE